MKGRIPVSDLPAWLLLDGASRSLLGGVGMKAGGWLGLVAIGPAGALVLGPAIGCAALAGNSALTDTTQKVLMKDWLKELFGCGTDLHAAISIALEKRIHHLSERAKRLQNASLVDQGLSNWLAARSRDDLVAALEDLAELGTAPNNEEHCIELLFKASDLAPGDATVLRAAGKIREQFGKKPGLQELLVERQLQIAGDLFDKHLKSRLRFWSA